MLEKIVAEMTLALLMFQATQVDVSAFMPHAISSPTLPVAGFSLSRREYLPQANSRIRLPEKTDIAAAEIITSARSVAVLDGASGMLLYGKNPDTPRAIGSITKLMTAMVFLDTKPDLTRSVVLLPDDYLAGGRVYLAYRDELMLGDVLRASLVGSDNTATQALVRFSGLSQDDFLARMNAKAQEIGMEQSTFSDVSGLSGENLSTAREVSLLLLRAKTYPEILSRTQQDHALITQASGFTVDIPSTNSLFHTAFLSSGFSLIAGKTGFIPEAGYCFTGAFLHDGHEIFTTVLGAETKDARFSDAANVTDWITQIYTWPSSSL